MKFISLYQIMQMTVLFIIQQVLVINLDFRMLKKHFHENTFQSLKIPWKCIEI